MQVVELLTGPERFVRLAVERKLITPSSSMFPADFGLPPTPTSATLDSGKGVSPKVFGLPKPYTGLYSASSYMANRPSYMRTREPGQVVGSLEVQGRSLVITIMFYFSTL